MAGTIIDRICSIIIAGEYNVAAILDRWDAVNDSVTEETSDDEIVNIAKWFALAGNKDIDAAVMICRSHVPNHTVRNSRYGSAIAIINGAFSQSSGQYFSLLIDEFDSLTAEQCWILSRYIDLKINDNPNKKQEFISSGLFEYIKTEFPEFTTFGFLK